MSEFVLSEGVDAVDTCALLCSDMAGTTVNDGTAVMDSFAAAVREMGLEGAARDRAMDYALATMGQSKIEVFRAILGEEHGAVQANAVFEDAYLGAVRAGRVAPMDGAEELFAWCRVRSIPICLTTGFAPPTRDAILDRLGWGDRVDLVLSPVDAGRGRPFPDMILAAVLRLGITSVRQVAVVGDTSSDLWSGFRSGASVVAGVLTGPQPEAELRAAPHTHILASVADLPEVLAAR